MGSITDISKLVNGSPLSPITKGGDKTRLVNASSPSASTRVTSVKLRVPAPTEQYIPGASLEQEAGSHHGATKLRTLHILSLLYTKTLNTLHYTVLALQFTV